MIMNVVFILVAIAFCILGCALLSRIKAWAIDLDNLIKVLEDYLNR